MLGREQGDKTKVEAKITLVGGMFEFNAVPIVGKNTATCSAQNPQTVPQGSDCSEAAF